MAGLEGAILGMGNPLLDISSVVPQSVLDKYELKAGDQILAEDKHLPLYEELKSSYSPIFIAGGATQNSIRVAQWMLQVPGATTYFGSVGSDENAKLLQEAAEANGVRVDYHVDAETPTGTCACCVIDGGERSLVANLGAANNYKVEHVKKPENWAAVEAARVIYSAGFFLTASAESMVAVAERANERDVPYCVNISAPFICEVPPFKEALLKVIRLSSFVFGNELEAAAFAKSEGWESDDLGEVALRISRLPKASGSLNRTVVITQGKEPTIVASNGKISLFPVTPVDVVVDTNGAGDAFVGGFLSQIAVGKSIAEAVRAGQYASGVVVQQSGCTFPSKPEGFVWA